MTIPSWTTAPPEQFLAHEIPPRTITRRTFTPQTIAPE